MVIVNYCSKFLTNIATKLSPMYSFKKCYFSTSTTADTSPYAIISHMPCGSELPICLRFLISQHIREIIFELLRFCLFAINSSDIPTDGNFNWQQTINHYSRFFNHKGTFSQRILHYAQFLQGFDYDISYRSTGSYKNWFTQIQRQS